MRVGKLQAADATNAFSGSIPASGPISRPALEPCHQVALGSDWKRPGVIASALQPMGVQEPLMPLLPGGVACRAEINRRQGPHQFKEALPADVAEIQERADQIAGPGIGVAGNHEFEDLGQ